MHVWVVEVELPPGGEGALGSLVVSLARTARCGGVREAPAAVVEDSGV